MLGFILILPASGAFASSQPVGGVATALPCQIELSAGYFYSKDKWEFDHFDAEPKIETNIYYGQIGYGLAPGWDIYLRAGGMDAKGKGELGIDSDTKFFASAGFHGRLFQYAPWNLSFGPIGNFAYYENLSDRRNIGGTYQKLELKDHYSADIGFGFQWQPTPWMTLFGGPFYHWDTAKLEYTSGNLSGDEDVNTKNSFGPRFGVNFNLSKNVWLQLEGQSRSYVSGGASIGINF
ncbi:MAG TPA: hypothetical protein DCR97_14300 [Deltaproteobacteria bacterium]|nr:hypothetical protein [Deltaproteobacteria bacterium]